MKKIILLLTIVMAVFADAMAQNNAIYVYRNDGGFNAFLKSKVDSMVCSHIDAEGVTHQDWQMQVIYTADSIYRIPLTAIDSISFPKSYLTCPDDNHPHAIDLGLPSGTKWCCMNVGATAPEGYGGYYAWGETSEKSVYNDVTYKYCSGTDTNGDGWYDTNETWQNIGSDIAGTSYDAAHVNMGGSWVMPSTTQQQELINKCSREWTQQNGVNGTLVTGPNGGKVFLPAAGYCWDDGLGSARSYGCYWSSSLYPHDGYAYSLYFNSGGWYWDYGYYRDSGLSVRAVCP